MGGIKLGKILGIEIILHWTLFLIVFILSWYLAGIYFPQETPGLSLVWYWTLGILAAAGLFSSVLLHELSHSLVAQRFGLPIKRIILFIFGGAAEMPEEPATPKAEFWIAIAGPLSSFGLAALFGLGAYLMSEAIPLLGVFLNYLFFINSLLAAFNLLPAFPLDGGRVFRAVVWHSSKNFTKATRIACQLGKVFACLFIIVGLFSVFGLYFSGFWLIFIGWFLFASATQSWQQHLIQKALAGVTIRDIIESGFRVDALLIPRYRELGWICSPEEEASGVIKRMAETKGQVFLVMDGERVLRKITNREILQYVESYQAH